MSYFCLLPTPLKNPIKSLLGLTLIFIIFFPFFKAFHTLLLWNLVCKSLTSQEHRLYIFNNSQFLSSSTMLCSWSCHNIKQTGSHKLYSLGTARINKYEKRISEDGGQHYVQQKRLIWGRGKGFMKISADFCSRGTAAIDSKAKTDHCDSTLIMTLQHLGRSVSQNSIWFPPTMCVTCAL